MRGLDSLFYIYFLTSLEISESFTILMCKPKHLQIPVVMFIKSMYRVEPKKPKVVM
jgi:hypothetical protein